MSPTPLSRRDFARLLAGLAATGGTAPCLGAARASTTPPLAEIPYSDVSVDSAPHHTQLANTHEVLMSLSEDSLLRPFRQMAGQAAPGEDLGGWYNYDRNYDWHRDDAGFAPGATFGQWVSALSRYYAITGAPATRDKVLRLNKLYGATLSAGFYEKNRFPAYCFDKLLLGLVDSQQLVGDRTAFDLLDRTTRVALPHLPRAAVEHGREWRPGKDQSYTWDESYTLPENLFIAWRRGAGQRYRELGVRFLDDGAWFDRLARGENVLAGRHAYSYVNSLSSAMQAYLTLGSGRHLRAARNAFDMLAAQSYPTGGWGPDEQLTTPEAPELFASLTGTHHSFETPCGAYAHFKLTRYLLRVSRDSRYGDSMERVMFNTVLGARPMQADGRSFYYADYNVSGRKVYSDHRFPCCSGTLPQVATDYGINAYLREPHGLYVNLYLPSSVRWLQGGARCTLTQSGEYPFTDYVSMRLSAQRSREFTLYLRIPAWAVGAHIDVNGARWTSSAEPGRFAALTRMWHDGDRIELALPRTVRLEAIDRRHPDTVALLAGPLVLFPIATGSARPGLRRSDLLSVRQVQPRRWETRTAPPLVLMPYLAIDEEEYSTFVTVTA